MSGTGKSQGVRVAVRTRPTASFATDYIKVSGDSVSIKMPKRESHGSDNAKDQWSWKFDKVLHNSSQEVTYNDVALPVVQSVLQGYNGTIMCYGQTGAGKTYTQLGGTSAYEYRGVQPRAIAEIFNYVNDSPQFDATIGVSYLEIYNEELCDLLAPEGATDKLMVAEDKVRPPARPLSPATRGAERRARFVHRPRAGRACTATGCRRSR